MTIDTDILIDRRRLKRRLVAWRIVAIVATMVLIVAVVSTGGRLDRFPLTDHVARYSVDGIIIADTNVGDVLAEIAENSRAKALIVRINSPGGTFVGGELLFKSLRRVAEHKPVVVVMETLATSAGYMAAIAGDRIVAYEGTLTGSIGVIMQTANVTEMLGKLGITTEALKSGPLKAVPSPFEPLGDEAREVTQGLITELHDLFVSMVAERRDLDETTARKLADGRVYTGRSAVGMGLIDAIGGELEVRDWLEAERGISLDLPVHDVPTKGPGEDLVSDGFSWAMKTVFPKRHMLDGLISVWHPSLY